MIACKSTIRIPRHIVEWTRQTSYAGVSQRRASPSQSANLEHRYRTIQNKIDKVHEDKLERHIDPEFRMAKNSRWKQERTEIEGQLGNLRKTNSSSMDYGIKLMELASKAVDLFKNMSNDEKRELLNLVLSNPRILNGSFEYDFKKPFSLFQNVVDLEKLAR